MKISSSANSITASSAYEKTLGNLSAAEQSDSFGDVFENALHDAIKTGHTAEEKTAQGLSGHGNLTDIVTSVAEAQTTLQTATALREKMVQSYQEIMKMSV